MVGTACIDLGYKHIVTTGTCERGAPEGRGALKIAHHNGRAIGKNGDTLAVVRRRSTRLRGPLVGTACIDLGYKHIHTTGTCERGAAEGGGALKDPRHNGRTIGKDGDVVSVVTTCSTRLRGPFVGTACIDLRYKYIVTTGTCERGAAEGGGAIKGPRHNGRAVGKDGDAIPHITTRSTRLCGPG